MTTSTRSYRTATSTVSSTYSTATAKFLLACDELRCGTVIPRFSIFFPFCTWASGLFMSKWRNSIMNKLGTMGKTFTKSSASAKSDATTIRGKSTTGQIWTSGALGEAICCVSELWQHFLIFNNSYGIRREHEHSYLIERTAFAFLLVANLRNHLLQCDKDCRSGERRNPKIQCLKQKFGADFASTDRSIPVAWIDLCSTALRSDYSMKGKKTQLCFRNATFWRCWHGYCNRNGGI